MTVRLVNENSYTHRSDSSVASNSLDTTAGRIFVSHSNGTIIPATSSTVIDGTSMTMKLFDSDNVTVAKKEVEYITKKTDAIYEVTISGGTITSADKDKFYTLLNSTTVDGSTESTSSGQLQMVKFISATVAEFRIV